MLAMLQGEPGERGVPGRRGVVGQRGPDGQQGPAGEQSRQRPQGIIYLFYLLKFINQTKTYTR